jgi:predicted acyl esterase
MRSLPAARLSSALVFTLLGCVAATPSASAALTARGSAEQVQVTGATPRATLSLLDRAGKVADTRKAGSLGGAVFRSVAPGAGYRVRQGSVASATVRVYSTRPAPLSTSGYTQTLPPEGYGYLTTRDGTKLAIDVRLPGGKGPFPTVVEYSGYGYARPSGAQSGISPIANLLGYAVVDVNVRGTGCSGGAFDFFEPNQSLDGYDVVETVARQPWVLNHKVGLMGISYGGISQLFVGATNPPSLAAIAPLSVLDNSATTLYPGGMLNTGFALNWTKDRDHDARVASATGGQAWALDRIKQGDATCKANQVLHQQAVNLVAKVRRNHFYIPSVADPVSPITFVQKIKKPVFLACQWTDEQTGGHCPTLAARFTGTTRKWFTFTNGTHIDSLDPETFNRWFDFLELYVARRAPRLPDAARASAPVIFKAAAGVDDVTLPDDPIQHSSSYASALAAFQKLPSVRILFDNGAGRSGSPGVPYPGFEQSFARWPLPGTIAKSWYLGAGGALSGSAPSVAGRDRFTWSRTARPATDFTGDTGSGGLWQATPGYKWSQNPAGKALSYVTAPLSSDTAIIGAGRLQAWIKASVPSVDLQATVTEIRPDGKETYVQSGWLRSSLRKLDPKKSTLLEPQPSLRQVDDEPLPAGRFAEVDVPLYYQGHVYRAGSRIRVILSAPSGDQPIWSFAEAQPRNAATVTLSRSRATPSRLVLPVVPGVRVPTPLPPCPGLRGEPCRDYVAPANTAG